MPTLGVEIATWIAITYGIKPTHGNVQFASLPGAADSDVADRLVAIPTAHVISWIASPRVRAAIRTCAPVPDIQLPT